MFPWKPYSSILCAGGSPPSPQPGAGRAAGGIAPAFGMQASVPPSPVDGNPAQGFPAALRPLPAGLAGRWSGDACAGGAANPAGGSNPDLCAGCPGGERRSSDGQRPRIHPLPPYPLALLRELVQHLKARPRWSLI